MTSIPSLRRDLAAGLLLGAALLAGLIAAERATAQAKAPTIVQSGIAFKPALVRIKAGSQVIFRNNDPFGHNVYSPAGTFDIGLQPPDQETPVTFAQPGDYEIRCRIHPKMRATIIVER